MCLGLVTKGQRVQAISKAASWEKDTTGACEYPWIGLGIVGEEWRTSVRVCLLLLRC